MPLRVVIPARSTFEEETNTFRDFPERMVFLEHSLLSMARWESVTKQCFFTSKLDRNSFALYIQCMCEEYLTEEDALEILKRNRKRIEDYLFDDCIARKRSGGNRNAPSSNQGRSKFLPTEQIYFHMFELGIPITCEKWHFSRLASLMRLYAQKNRKGGKHKASPEQIARISAINRSRLNGS